MRNEKGQFLKGLQPWNKGTKGLIKPNSGSFSHDKQVGEKHPKWKGDQVGYDALHAWVRRTLGTPQECENCGDTQPRKYEWANISGEYKRDISDWARLCVSCHKLFDNPAKKAAITRCFA